MLKIRITEAFTLVELLIVIIVIGVLSAVALPRFLDSSTDAYRALNNSTVGALNTATANIMANARLNVPVNTLSGSPTIQAIAIDSTSNPIVAIWTVLSPYYYPIAASTNGVSAFNSPATNGYYAYTMFNTTQAACSDIFNALLNANSSTISAGYSGYSSVSAIFTAAGTPTNFTYTALSVGTSPTGKNGVAATGITSFVPTTLIINNTSTTLSNSAANLPATTTATATTPLPATPGGCLYQLTASAKTGTAFYIYYSGGVFTAVELQ